VLKDVPPHLVRLATDCLDQAAPTCASSGDLAAATERACASLTSHLGRRLGRRRAQALLVLGLALARADCPVLVDLEATPDGRLPALAAALGGCPLDEVHAALVALLAHTLALIATLEGDAAATRAGRVLVCAAARPKRSTRPT
jgi:hypothetical protein